LATVITNLLSAIPVFGTDIVELIWGGLNFTVEPHYGDIVLKILLNAGTSPNYYKEFAYDLFLMNSMTLSTIYVKTAKTWRKPAGVLQRSLHTSESSQRLHAGDLMYIYLVGLFEGDGYFSVSKKGKYVQCELGIELSIKDVQLIYKIKDLLGVGVVGFRERKGGISMVYFRVRKKDHLINNILPIFDKYPLFSDKQFDYLRLREVILSNIVFYEDLPKYTRPSVGRSSLSINSIESILSTSYFSAWLVGFIEAEACFSVYKLKKPEDYEVASFDISQTDGEILILAIRKYLSLNPKVYKDKTNNFKLKVSSVRSLENIIKFLNKAPVKLLGNKKLQYILWIKKLRQIPRYAGKIKIPSNY
jgi:hypothetical protein